ncbi:MAG: hypothetical protein ACREO4_01595 [Lysobacter sp.]
MTTDKPSIDPKSRNRNRGMLIAIAALFFGSMLVAGVLRFSGWTPEGRKNHGVLLDPPADLRTLVPSLADGGEYRWNPDARTWRIAVAPPADCGPACATLAEQLDTVWRLFGKDADRVHLLWVCGTEACMPPEGAPRPRTLHVLQPDPRLLAALPPGEVSGIDSAATDPATGGAVQIPVYVIDPNGFVILRYAPGFDPVGLRADMAKLLKLI